MQSPQCFLQNFIHLVDLITKVCNLTVVFLGIFVNSIDPIFNTT